MTVTSAGSGIYLLQQLALSCFVLRGLSSLPGVLTVCLSLVQGSNQDSSGVDAAWYRSAAVCKIRGASPRMPYTFCIIC